MRDFSENTYKYLLEIIKSNNYHFQTFEQELFSPSTKVIILRHDIDRLPDNALRFARIEKGLGINSTYYFRIEEGSFNKEIIKEIYSLGHEIGYHYEEVSSTAQKQKKGCTANDAGLKEEEIVRVAIERFKENLAKLREIVPVNTICMHGSPLSKWDSRLLWKYFDYHDFGIIGEPYFDIDFNEVLYLTDTGRCWDGDQFNIRDKATVPQSLRLSVFPSLSPSVSSSAPHAANLKSFPKFHSTFDIIRAAEDGKLPDKIMMTFHPQRWTNKLIPWLEELVWQNVKNVVKYFLVKWRDE